MSSSDASSSASSSSSGSSKRGVKRKRETVQPLPAEWEAKKIAALQELDDKDSSDSDSDSDDSSEDSDESPGGDAPQEAEVLSHAAQRKLKKKAEKNAKKQESDPSHKPQDGTGTVPKRQNSVWVGNLAFKTTEQALRAFFQRGVPGCEMTRVNLPTKTGQEVGGGRGMRGENRGFAYVDFVTKKAKEKAISLSEQNLDGRKLLIKDGDDFTGRPAAISTTAGSGEVIGLVTSAVGKSKTAQRILAAQKQPPAPTLFLGNLGFQATEESIRGMIEGHMKSRRKEDTKEGAIEIPKEAEAGAEGEGDEKREVTKDKKWLRKVRLGTFEDSGLCKGWAFVDFVSIEDATNVLVDPRNHHLDGRKLVVEYASAEAVRRGGGPGAKAHRNKMESNVKGRGEGRWAGKSDRREHKSEDRPTVQSSSTENLEGVEGPPQKKPRRVEDEREGRGGKARRTKPGAALALAQREKVAIVPSSGKKIVF